MSSFLLNTLYISLTFLLTGLCVTICLPIFIVNTRMFLHLRLEVFLFKYGHFCIAQHAVIFWEDIY